MKNVETAAVFEKSEVKVWECRNCGHLVVGTKAPEVCPTCAHPQSYFEVRLKIIKMKQKNGLSALNKECMRTKNLTILSHRYIMFDVRTKGS